MLESPLILFIFKRENKILNITLKVTPFGRKNMSMKIESKSEGQVTYWEGTQG